MERPGIVCDPFMGSGTTGRAARMLGHRFVGFELDIKMCEIANSYALEVNQMRLSAV